MEKLVLYLFIYIFLEMKVSAFGEHLKIGGPVVGRKMSTVGMSSMSFSSFRCPPLESLTHSHFGSAFVVALDLLLVKKKKLLGPIIK